MSPIPPYRARMEIQAGLRAALQSRGYREVVTPILHHQAGTDPEIEPMAVPYLPRMDRATAPDLLYAHTSPEFAMKRLLMREPGPVYQICQVMRQGELGAMHSPEFTMAEWYRPGIGCLELMDEVEKIVRGLLPERGPGGEVFDHARAPFLRISFRDAATAAGAEPPPDSGRAERLEWFYRVCVDRLDPWLSERGAVFIHDFPAEAAVLAKLKDDDPTVAERFELFIDGIEVANGAAELADPAEHRRRFELDRALREARGAARPPPPECFLADLEKFGLPPCAGVALGVERLAAAAYRRAFGEDPGVGAFMAFPFCS